MGNMQLADWNQLATLAGAAGVVAVIVGFLKSITPWLQGARTLILVWVLSLIICVVATAKGGRAGQQPDYVLAVINSFLVAATAAGVREGQRSVRGLSGPVAAPPSSPEPPENENDGDDSD
jgi:hypothetical protein